MTSDNEYSMDWVIYVQFLHGQQNDKASFTDATRGERIQTKISVLQTCTEMDCSVKFILRPPSCEDHITWMCPAYSVLDVVRV
jgi:hypothetical protein